MAKSTGLGKGLAALLGDDFSAADAAASSLPISQIEPFSGQPRKHFDPEALEELAQSIRQHGVIQPLTVRKLSSGYYQIIAGERRWRAAKLAGLKELPVVIIEADDRKAMELAMIENLQREDLNPMEAAQGFQALMDQYNMTQEQVAERVGKSRSAVANTLRLLGLTPAVRSLLEEGKLSAGHARTLLPLEGKAQAQAAQTVLDHGLSVRQTEQLVKRLLSQKPERRQPASPAVDYVAEAERDLSNRLGRACHIAHGKKKGKVEITYYGVDDLNALLDALGRLELGK